MTLLHSIDWFLGIIGVVAVIRWNWRRSRLIGVLLSCGALLRAIVGVALFWISLKHLPILPQLQLGDGFWLLALDGRSYFEAARAAAEHGLSTVSSSSASPTYVRLLAVALHVFGETPLTAVLLNVAAYALASTICMLMWPRQPTTGERLTRGIAVVALAFTPSLLLTSTQPLKDQVFALAIVAVAACIRIVLRAVKAERWDAAIRGIVGVAGASAMLYAIAGIRAYYGLIIIVAAAAVMAAAILRRPLRRWPLHIAAAAAVTVALWTAFAYGAGPYAEPYQRFIWTTLHIPRTAAAIEETSAPFDSAREGFVTSGGDTNIVRLHTPGANAFGERVIDDAVGVMDLVVPISVLQALAIIKMSGGRGLLIVTDVETIFLDVTILLQLWLIYRQWRRGRSDSAFLMFTIALAVAVMLPMAYVVTNYGTMFRMRVMYAIPLWLSGAAVVAVTSTRWGEPDQALGDRE